MCTHGTLIVEAVNGNFYSLVVAAAALRPGTTPELQPRALVATVPLVAVTVPAVERLMFFLTSATSEGVGAALPSAIDCLVVQTTSDVQTSEEQGGP